MNINERLVDKLIASTALNVNLVPGLNDAATKGPFAASIGLDKIADTISINMAAMPDSSSHARPSMLASISSFAENVRLALDAISPGRSAADFAALSSTCKQDFTEWQAMIAMVSLCNIYSGSGLKLSVTPFFLSSENLVEKCVLLEMDKDACYRGAITRRHPVTQEPLEGYLHYICQNGEPFALYHPDIALCPMKSYRADMFRGVVEWYASQMDSIHKSWKPIMSLKSGANNGSPWQSCLDSFCLSRIAWWAGQNGLRLYQNFLLSFLGNSALNLPPQLAAPNSIENAANIDNVWPDKGTPFGTVMMFYCDANSTPRPMPKLFLEDLLITYTGAQDNNLLVYNTPQGEAPVAFSGNDPELKSVAPVMPLSNAIMELLQVGSIQQVTFDPVVESGKLRSVSVTLTLSTNPDSRFSLHKLYDADHLRFGKLPYLSLWPFVPLPDGMNLWKQFYATWQDINKEVDPLPKATGGYIRMVDHLGFDFEGQGTATRVYRPPYDREHWTVCTNNQPFRYAMVYEELDGQYSTMGIVFMPAYPMYRVNNDVSVVNIAPVQLAVDFGTTSTVCALRSSYLNHDIITPLCFRDYSRAVTCYDQEAKRLLDTEHWLGNPVGGSSWYKNNKIFSVAQLFERKDGGGANRQLVSDAEKQKYYIDGRMFLISGSTLTNYATIGSSDKDPLQNQQIMNDMKFNEKLDVKNYQAASVFLAGVYTYAVLYLLSEKIIPGRCDFLELRVSYPNSITLDALTKSWDYAKAIVGRLMDGNMITAIDTMLSSRSHFYSEAISTSAYQRNLNVAVKAARHLVSLDIGGGTTDISITSTLYPNRAENLSFRYAGREIMVSSLISYFRRFEKNAQYDLDSEFRSIWQNADESILDQFHRIRQAGGIKPTRDFLHSLLTNSSARMDVELLLSEGMTLKPVAISDSTNLLRQLIALKFFMVLRLAALAVREHIDMLKHPETGMLDMMDNQLTIDLSVSGTSSQLLQYVFDCTMVDLQWLNSPGCPAHMTACKDLMTEIFSDILRDEIGPNAAIDLQIHIDPNVKEKQEVCFGMLQANIDDYRNAPAPAPQPVQQPASAPAAGGIRARMAARIQPQRHQSAALTDASRQQKISDMKQTLRNYPADRLQSYVCGEVNDAGNDYIKLGLLPYLYLYESEVMGITPAAQPSNRGLGYDIQNISDLLANYSSASLSLSRMDVAETRAVYMVEPEQDPYRDELACMYLVDEILDWEMADRQM